MVPNLKQQAKAEQEASGEHQKCLKKGNQEHPNYVCTYHARSFLPPFSSLPCSLLSLTALVFHVVPGLGRPVSAGAPLLTGGGGGVGGGGGDAIQNQLVTMQVSLWGCL